MREEIYVVKTRLVHENASIIRRLQISSSSKTEMTMILIPGWVKQRGSATVKIQCDLSFFGKKNELSDRVEKNEFWRMSI